ncbi:MAG: DUF1223 domain-containing protein [Pseudomonadota bacterium]
MRHMLGAACGLMVGLAQPVFSQTAPAVVVELYTSQGCTACPPADDYMARFADDPQIILLSLHVDYWDYIGWADKFASPAFTARQKSYARAINSRTIYTPQIVVGGIDRVEGFDPPTFEGYLAVHRKAPQTVDLALTRVGDTLAIKASADAPFDVPARVDIVRYMPSQTVAIERGENAGRSVTYRNIVTSWETLGEWTGQEPLALTAAVLGPDPVVVVVQAPGPSRILAAARVK